MSRPALLWDLDGTLVDSEPLHLEATDAALAELGLTPPAGFHDTALGLSTEQTHHMLVRDAGLPLPNDAWEDLRFKHIETLAPGLQTREPAARLAAEAARKGYPQAVVSNSGRAEVDLALRATGLTDLFPVTVTHNDVSQGKPHPEGYRKAAALLSVDPARCLAIEDSTTGAAAALAAGATVIFHPQSPHLSPPDGATYLPPDGDLTPLIQAHLLN